MKYVKIISVFVIIYLVYLSFSSFMDDSLEVAENINKTLEDSEINKISEKIIKETSKKFNAVLRS